jgi:hypothetical protein
MASLVVVRARPGGVDVRDSGQRIRILGMGLASRRAPPFVFGDPAAVQDE